MKTYKVYTKWIGYSEIEVEAESPTHAQELVEMGDYDSDRELTTGHGLIYGFDNESVIEVEEVENERT
jgi:hypothetical protein